MPRTAKTLVFNDPIDNIQITAHRLRSSIDMSLNIETSNNLYVTSDNFVLNSNDLSTNTIKVQELYINDVSLSSYIKEQAGDSTSLISNGEDASLNNIDISGNLRLTNANKTFTISGHTNFNNDVSINNAALDISGIPLSNALGSLGIGSHGLTLLKQNNDQFNFIHFIHNSTATDLCYGELTYDSVNNSFYFGNSHLSYNGYSSFPTSINIGNINSYSGTSTFQALTASGLITANAGLTVADGQTFASNQVDINGGAIDGTNITVGAGKTLNVSQGILNLADDQISGDKVEGGIIDSITISQLAGAMDCNTNAMTNVNIDSGDIDGTNITVGAGKTLNVSQGTLTLANDQISGDKINGGIIDSITISQLGGAMDCNNEAMTNINIDSGAIDNTIIGANTAVAATFSQISLYHLSGNSTITTDVNKITIDPFPAQGDISGTVVIKGDLIVDGTTTTINSTTVDISDSILTLNSNLASNVAPSVDAGFLVNRGSLSNVSFLWDETNTRWTIGSETFYSETLKTTNLEVSNLKANDGTVAGSIANSTGIVTLTSSVLTTTDINGGSIDGTNITVGAGKTLNVSQGNLALADNQISGDKINGGTIDSITISQLGGAMDCNNQAMTNINIDGGAIDGTVIGANSAAAGTFTTITASNNVNLHAELDVDGKISADGGIEVSGNVLPINTSSHIPVTYNTFSLINSGINNDQIGTSTGWSDANGFDITKTLLSANSYVKMEFKANFISSPEADQTLSFRVQRSTDNGSNFTTIFTDSSLGSNMGVTIRNVYNGTFIDEPQNTNVRYKLQYNRDGTDIDTSFGIVGGGNYIFLQELYVPS